VFGGVKASYLTVESADSSVNQVILAVFSVISTASTLEIIGGVLSGSVTVTVIVSVSERFGVPSSVTLTSNVALP